MRGQAGGRALDSKGEAATRVGAREGRGRVRRHGGRAAPGEDGDASPQRRLPGEESRAAGAPSTQSRIIARGAEQSSALE
eukprot:1773152-Pyramimonas_sp.AAC.1